VPVFVKDPEVYLNDLEIEVACAVNPRVKAQIEKESCSIVNYEIYFFSEAREKKAFDKDPLAYCGILTDPVSKQRFKPSKKAKGQWFADRAWYFVSDSTQALFAAMPDSFVTPDYSMKPQPKVAEPAPGTPPADAG